MTKNSKIETGYLDSQDIIENQLSQYLHTYPIFGYFTEVSISKLSNM